MRAIRQSILFFILLSTLATACQVPVFRYALERWESDNYQLFVVTPKALDSQQTQWLVEFQKQSQHANITLNILDTSKLTDAQLWKLPPINTSVQSAQLVLFPPRSQPNKSPVTTLPFTPKNLTSIIDSPTRQQVIKNIIEGSSCVWLVIHQGEPEKAKQLQQQLDTHLRKVEKNIQIPDGIIGTEERHKITDSTDLEDVLRSSIPLKIAFSSILIDRNDPAEKTFIDTLLTHSPESITKNGESLIIPIFGRGRILPPMPASRLSYQAIFNGCQYLCGACSCQVKEQNPGFDLLINENWPSHLTSGLAVIDKTLPPLDGVGDIIPEKKSPATPDQTDKPAPAKTPKSIISGIPIIIGGVLLVLIIFTLVTLKKNR